MLIKFGSARWLIAGALAFGPCLLRAQDQPPVIRSISIETQNIFDSAQAQGSFAYRAANAIHSTTRQSVVRNELLFKVGQRLDSARIAETLRNLRARGLFREVSINTARDGDSVDIEVVTLDGWTTELVVNARVTDGQFTWALGGQERNFLGTGARVGLVFRQEPDRSAWTVRAGHDRIAGSRFGVDGVYDNLSDGTVGLWRVGVPFRSLSDRTGVDLVGEAANQRVLQWANGEIFQTYQRRAFIQRASAAYAPFAGPRGYLRLGINGQIRREEFILDADTGMSIPDSVTATFGGFAELLGAQFKVVTHYNGFARAEDLDLSHRITLEVWVAPKGMGYERPGIGPALSVRTGFDAGAVFGSVLARANGLFTSGGLDTGQVFGGLTIAAQIVQRFPTVFHIEGAARTGTPPGEEYDLGHGIGPRAFVAHSFTGERMYWWSIEQRAFLIDEVLGLFGVGFAAFLDYGGAWYTEQPRRTGGNAGFGLRIGPTRSTGSSVGRIDFAYRFGEGWSGRRWAFSFGRGFLF